MYFSCSFCLNMFKLCSFLWFCIQQALGCEKQVRCLRVTINLPRKFNKEIGATPIFKRILVLFEYIYNLLKIVHQTSPFWWNLDQVLESYSQFSIFGPNVPNKETEYHTYFLWIYCFILKFLQSSHDSASNKPLVLKIGSGTWKLMSIFHFWPKCPK